MNNLSASEARSTEGANDLVGHVASGERRERKNCPDLQ